MQNSDSSSAPGSSPDPDFLSAAIAAEDSSPGPETLELGSISMSRMSSRKGSVRESRESLAERYRDVPREDLLNALVTAELLNLDLEDENYALIEQTNQFQKDITELQGDFTSLKRSHSAKIKLLEAKLEEYKDLAKRRESEIIFLEDHARFSADQTKLSISHWDLLLKNRDENIELLTSRVEAMTNERRLNHEVTLDKFKCMQERLGEGGECPWRSQAEVRVSQLERVTGQLNATYEQLHAKSDELLLQNREMGNLRRKLFEAEAKVRRYRSRLKRNRNAPTVAITESSSIHSSD